MRARSLPPQGGTDLHRLSGLTWSLEGGSLAGIQATHRWTVDAQWPEHHGMQISFALGETCFATKAAMAALFFGGSFSACLAQQTGSTDEYRRGFLWGQMHGVVNDSACAGVSDSFTKGCAEFVADQRRIAQKVSTIAGAVSTRSTLGLDSMGLKVSCGAAARLERASNQLASCARQIGSYSSCGSRYRDVRDAYDDYSTSGVESSETCGHD